MDLRFIRNTKSRQQVQDVIKKSIELKNQGLVQEIKNWDKNNLDKYNSLYTHNQTGKKWVIYLPDHAYSGEVKVLDHEQKK
tara:strand:- start:479 stop:721 length:243 start_codon:yes stop_codon:yes gene_type:complete